MVRDDRTGEQYAMRMQRQHQDARTPLMRIILSLVIVASLAIGLGCLRYPTEAETNPAVKAQRVSVESFDSKIEEHAETLLEEGRKIFRFDTFGSEGYWGDKLRLHEAIMGEQQGGVGPGLTPKEALVLASRSMSESFLGS
jgi:hypothetical protein